MFAILQAEVGVQQLLTTFLDQHVQQLQKLALLKLMKSYLCDGFLILVESNWCFPHHASAGIPLRNHRYQLSEDM